MKIAIYGDSFGIAPSPKRKDPWYQQLAQMLNAEATSFAYPGSSNFYNYKNFLKHNKDFDLNIFIHTSSLKYPIPVKLSNVKGVVYETMWPSSLNAVEFYRDEWFEGPMDDISKEILNHLYSWYVISDDQFMSLSVELMMNDMEARRPNTIFLASFDYDPSWEMNPYYDTGRNRKEKLSVGFPDFMNVQAKSLGIQGDGNQWQENFEFISCHMTPETNAVFGKSVYDLITTGKMTPPPAHIHHNYGPEHYFIQTK